MATGMHDAQTVTLLLLAHHDDEVFCAGHAARALAAGGRLRVVWATAGGLAPGGVRMREGRAALRALGVPVAHGHDLAFADQGALDRVGEIAAAADAAVGDVAPGHVRCLVPAYEGGHPDHDAVNLAAALLRARRPDVEIREFALYRRSGLWLSVQSPAPPAATVHAPFVALPLDGAALGLRRRLAAANVSQLVPSLLPLLAMSRLAGRGRSEPSRLLPDHDYRRAPGRRPLLYELYTRRRFEEFASAAAAALGG